MPGPDLHPLLAWGRSLGVTGEPTCVRQQPWATTARVGEVWLKACGDGGRYEAALLGGLLWWGAPHTVLPLAVDAERGYAALPHAGRSLHELECRAEPWPQLLAEHAALQRRLQPHAGEAVALGVPDQRPAALPGLLDDLLARTPLEENLRRAVDQTRPRFNAACRVLAAGPVAVTVQHDDFYDRNVVVDERGAARALDWGDSSVGHPFGVLLVTLRVLARRYGLDDADRDQLRKAYLEAWTDVADLAALHELAGAAEQVQPLARALSWERALRTVDDAERSHWGGPVTGWLEVLAGREAAVLG